MRLKTFDAPSMTEAMRQLRGAFGDDAVIVSTQRTNGGSGVRVTAAQDTPDEVIALPNVLNLAAPPAVEDAVEEALEAHGTPRQVIERLVGTVADGPRHGPCEALANALTADFGFDPLAETGVSVPIALVGMPGAGKTITIAKLAARAALADRPVRVVTTDGFRAGGVDQLSAFTKLLEIELHKAISMDELKRVAKAGVDGELVLVDTAGVNPFNRDEVGQTAEMVDAIGAEPILTLSAGGDPSDALEIGQVFGSIGAKRMIVTRLDAARRLGAIVAAADGGSLAFSNVSVSPHVARGFQILGADELARLLLCDPGHRNLAFTFDEASV
jgi:flagellar biosynthesis protein FlhF